MRSFHYQNGDTLIGLIFGLVIGLAIAVLVAMLITQHPMPFMTSHLSTTQKSRLDNTSANLSLSLIDPNRSLYDKTQTPKTPSATLPVKKSPDVLMLLPSPALSLKALPSFAQKTPVSNGLYYLQVGAFRNALQAENIRAELALMGIEAVHSTTSDNHGILHRVRVGPFSQTDRLNSARKNLLDHGMNTVIIPASATP